MREVVIAIWGVGAFVSLGIAIWYCERNGEELEKPIGGLCMLWPFVLFVSLVIFVMDKLFGGDTP